MGWGKWVGCVVGGVGAIALAPILVPAIGAFASIAGLGAAAGTLTGAAASSAGLAALGGGSIAAGGLGLGVAGGSAVVTAATTAIGVKVGGSLGGKVVPDKISYPAIGSVVWCDLLCFEHSGIYVGNEQIVHLNGNGMIEKCSARVFTNRLDGYNTAMSVYTACNGGNPVGDHSVARRAMDAVGDSRDYLFCVENCHRFTAYCLTGENTLTITFIQLESKTWNVLSGNNWREWKIA